LTKEAFDTYLELLTRNPQVNELTILGESSDLKDDEREVHREALEQIILPIILSSFLGITSLRLAWNSKVLTVPVSELSTISQMKALK